MGLLCLPVRYFLLSLIAGLIKAHLGSHKVFAGGDGSFRLNNTASKGKRSNLDFSLYSMIFKTLAPGWVLAEPSRPGLHPPLTAGTSVCPCQQHCCGVSVPGRAMLRGRALCGTPGFLPESSVMLPWRLCPNRGDVGALALLPQRAPLWRCGLFVLLRAQHEVVFWFCCSFGD